MVEYPKTVRSVFIRDLPLWKKLAIGLNWGKIRELMIARMDLGTVQGQESRDIVGGELDWLDGLLSDGRRFLVGDKFSRADLAAASLLAPLVLPPEHSMYDKIEHPPRMAADIAAWEQRPSFKWIRDIYREYR